ncbi:hypothetical protein ACI797_08350 [Geodermatophilus sp. SYSU D00691]
MSSTPIADRHSCALVDRAGTVQWLCCSRFDGPAPDAGFRSHLEPGAATAPLDGGRGRLERACRGVAGEGEHRG